MVTIEPEDEQDLTKWVRRAVAPLIDTPPDVLTNYVVVLLKSNTNLSESALESKCRTELEYFLKDKADAFVDSLFEAIRAGSYKYQADEEDTGGNGGYGEEDEVAGGGGDHDHTYGEESFYEEEEVGHGVVEEDDSVDGGRGGEGGGRGKDEDRWRRDYGGDSDDEDRRWDRGDKRQDGRRRSRSRSPSPPTTSSGKMPPHQQQQQRQPQQQQQQQQQQHQRRDNKVPFPSMPPREGRDPHNNRRQQQQQPPQPQHPHPHSQQNWNRGGGGGPHPRGVNGQMHHGGRGLPGPGMIRPFPMQEGPRGPDSFMPFGGPQPPPPPMPRGVGVPPHGRPPFPQENSLFMGRPPPPPPNMMGQPMPMPPFGGPPPMGTGTMRIGNFNQGPQPQPPPMQPGFPPPPMQGGPPRPPMAFGGEGTLRMGGPGPGHGGPGGPPGMNQPRPPPPGPMMPPRPMPHQGGGGGGGGGASWPVAQDFNRDRIIPMPLEPLPLDRGRPPPTHHQHQPPHHPHQQPPQQQQPRGLKRPAEEMRKGGPPPPQQRERDTGGPMPAPLPDSEKTTLRISMIPKEVHMGLLEGHCKQFGKVVELRLRPQPGALTNEGHPCNQAFVQYATHQQARQCLTSPASVANNRFIVVEWAPLNLLTPDKVTAILEREKQEQQQQQQQQQQHLQQQSHGVEGSAGGGGGGGRGEYEAEEVHAPPRKVPALPSRQEAKLSNAKAELLRKQLDISKQKESLLTKQLALARTSLEKAVARLGEDHEEVAKSKANLANIETMLQEAKEEVASLAEAAAVQVTVIAPGFRGGRGMRGGPGGRAQRGGRFGAARGPMRIDNRTTCLKLLNRPGDTTELALQSFFATFGAVDSVAMEGSSVAIIKFAARHMAEKAMASAKVLGETQLQLEWFDPRLAGGGAEGSKGGGGGAKEEGSSSLKEEGPPPVPYGLEDDGMEEELDYQAYYEII